MPNAVSRYAQRVAVVPRAAAEKWAAVGVLEPLAAVFSLAALEGLWSDNEFSSRAFDGLVAMTRRSS